MKTMTAKYPGKCVECGGAIQPGQLINFFGKGRAAHVHSCKPESNEPRKPDAPCWLCQAPEGYFRARGAATPVWCDKCNAEQSAGDLKLGTTTILDARRGGRVMCPDCGEHALSAYQIKNNYHSKAWRLVN